MKLNLSHNFFNTQNVFVFGIFLMAASLPFSKFLLSLSQFILAISWLINGFINYDFLKKIKQFANNRIALSLSVLFFIHIVWLINTTDFSYAFHDIRIKLPLFIVPFLFSTFPLTNLKTTEIALKLFSVSTIIATFYCFFVSKNLFGHNITDIRNASVFISHIRFGLMIAFAIIILAYYIIKCKYQKIIFVINSLCILWLLYFLFQFESVTGLGVLVLSVFFALFYFVFSKTKIIYKICLLLFIALIPIAIYAYLKPIYTPLFKNTSCEEKLDSVSDLGNPYFHNTKKKIKENNHLIWTYVQWGELAYNWNQRSNIRFDSIDAKKQNISGTLIRYLTSKGLRKDKTGVDSLTDNDIENIEKGITNYLYPEIGNLNSRIYRVFWEIHAYQNGGNPNGHSIVQRYIYWQAGWYIFTQNILFGTGTGDVKSAYDSYYKNHNAKLQPNRQLRTHNQYLTLLVAFGIIGFLLFVIAWFYPILKNKQKFLLIMFFVISTASFFTEDTLETQVGVTFFIFFNSLFLLLPQKNKLK